jgi:deoxyribodipyrimidine photo-lyase
VVPVELASDKQEHAARTLRPRIHEYLGLDFLVELKPTEVGKQSLNMSVDSLNLSDIEAVLNEMDLDRGVEPVSHLYRGGTSAASEILEDFDFVKNRFDDYVGHRNQPQTDNVSHMSKYLHRGHVSPIYLALEVKRAGAGQDNVDSYLEEVVVRRELSISFQIYKTPRAEIPHAANRQLSRSAP